MLAPAAALNVRFEEFSVNTHKGVFVSAIYREGNTAKLAYDPPSIVGGEDDESEDCTIEMVEANHVPY